MVYYADTSVLVKRHISETGTAWVKTLTRPAAMNTIFTAQISFVELYSALNRRLRENSITPLRYSRFASQRNSQSRLVASIRHNRIDFPDSRHGATTGRTPSAESL